MTPEQKTIILHVGALNALVLGLFTVMAGRDPEMVREIVDAAEELASASTGPDVEELQGIVAGLVQPIRDALADMEQADTMGKH